MSRTLDIFIDSDQPIQTFARDMEFLLGVHFRRVAEYEQTLYEYQDANVDLTLGPHELENDRDMKFEDYRYQISIRARNVGTEDQRRGWRDAFGLRAFEALKRTSKYPLMLVDDVQKKLDEFHP